MNKYWYESKTLWANIIALLATVATAFGLDLGLGPEQQATIVAGVMAIVNIVLRFKTDKAIEK
jgi:hypothetical protein